MKQHNPPPRRGRWPRLLAWLLADLALALLLALAGAWLWAGTEGSLATALRWVSAVQPIVAEGVTGKLRGAGKARRLTWESDGLRVEVQDAELRWTPAALRIDHFSASRIEIDHRSSSNDAPSAGPPQSLALPLGLQVRQFTIGELRWAGPPSHAAHDVTGHLDYDGARYLLALDRARVEGGLYRARATLTAHAPVSVELALNGEVVTPPAPGGIDLVPLAVQATLQGPLDDLRAQIDLRADPAGAAAATADPPEAHASARITAWAAQPLPEAHARVRALDAGALWPDAPRTALTGQIDLTPLPPSGPASWAVRADLANAASGPWNQRRLPLGSLRADLTWGDGAATVRALSARVGSGALEASGHWAAGQGNWQIDARIEGVNPFELHTQLASGPVDGRVKLSGVGTDIGFDAALQARARPAQASAHELPLRELLAVGRWDQGLLTLDRLRLLAGEAELTGQASLRVSGGADSSRAAPGGSAELSLTAPGATLALKGQLQPGSGGGVLHARISDAARLLAWAQKLPGASGALAGAQADGHARLDVDWRGGWRDPALQARLTVPRLDWRAPGGAAPIQARNSELAVAGKLAQARIDFGGQVTQGQRQIDLRLAASGGCATPGAPLARSSWRLELGSLQASVRDAAQGEGAWQLATRGAVPLAWSLQGGGRFEAGAGEITLASPEQASQAIVAWGPARWRAGDLATTGRITGLPLQWVERATGARLADAGLNGDVMLNGDWDITVGRELRVNASLARASGDLTVLAADPQTGVQTRVAAGLREARLTLASAAAALNLQLKWDSERAGAVDAALRTELSATPSGAGGTRWAWTENAPLQGWLRARLPRLSAWSALAPPGWRLRGALQADMRISGTRAAPLAQGRLAADGLALRSVVDGLQFGGGRLRARLDGVRLLINEFVLHGAGGQDGGGTLSASGDAGWIEGRAQARLAVTLDKLRASIRADRQLTVSGNAQAALDGRQIKADGRLRVDRALIALPDESAPSLEGDVIVRGQPALDAVAQPAAQSSPLGVAANVQIDLGDDFRLQGMGIDTRLAGALTLAADGPITAMPRLTGAVRTVDGSVRAYGQRLVISRGSIVFTGEAGNPALDIIAVRPNYASEQRVGAQVMGTALLPRVRLYSQPELPDNETLAWLLLGRPAPSSGAEAAMLQSAALALLGGREGKGLAARFGLDELNFSGASDGTLADASVTLGKRLSDRLYAAYEHSLSGAGGTLLIFYELSRRWMLRSQTNENAAVDLVYRLSFD
ncbi:MAG: translocation/assembly module TamB domain-containing protein [Desulfovibrionaceae bacterium]|nr:translocation/assembly module TamB domain-containing protein [Desulfovibrionaceae bacterium]